MQTSTTNTLGKKDRLKSRKAIEALFATGQSFSLYPFKVVYQLKPGDAVPASIPGLQCAFSVSKRNFKKAVDRNRVKRLMREAWRLQNGALKLALQTNPVQLQVFLIYTGKEIPEYTLVTAKAAAALKRLIKIAHETTAVPA